MRYGFSSYILMFTYCAYNKPNRLNSVIQKLLQITYPYKFVSVFCERFPPGWSVFKFNSSLIPVFQLKKMGIFLLQKFCILETYKISERCAGFYDHFSQQIIVSLSVGSLSNYCFVTILGL
jgi:hypothetical protein